MLFNSWEFFIFFPIITIIYFLVPKGTQKLWLLIASCIFYMAYIPSYILVLFYLIAIDFFAGILIEKAQSKSLRKSLLIFSIVANLGTLAFFKYYHFLGLPLFFQFALPVGLSFHTFQSVSYVIEVYRKKVTAEKNVLTYALYVLFYPQLVAGPIERPLQLLPQLNKKQSFSFDSLVFGLRLMLWGLFKKMVVADNIAHLINPVFSDLDHASGLSLLLGVYLFAFQIYCDFSGYTDIAIGAAQVMGIRLTQNFNFPYLATSISDFWSRWHISLSSWFRDYLYIPLGGNRKGQAKTYSNLMVVFLLSGLWHGADWKFVLWGGIHGVYIILENIFGEKFNRVPKIFKIFLTFNLVSFAWIFFRANTISDAFKIIKIIGYGLFDFSKQSLKFDINQLTFIVALIAILEVIQRMEKYSDFRKLFSNKPVFIQWLLCYLLIFSIIFLAEFSENKFIYFQF